MLDDDVSWDGPDDLGSPYAAAEAEEYPEEDRTEDLRRQSLESAVKALEYYNKKFRVKYELVDAMISNGFLYCGIWIHCNFKAKPEMSPTGDGGSSTKLFFTELFYPSGKTTSCWSCGDDIKHPTHGFRVGHKRYRPYDLRFGSRCGY